MASSPAKQDSSKPLGDYGRVAARVRAYHANAEADSKAPVGPIPARLRPETVKFLQSDAPAEKPKEGPVRRKAANQLIPTISSQRGCRPLSTRTFYVPSTNTAGKDTYPSNDNERNPPSNPCVVKQAFVSRPNVSQSSKLEGDPNSCSQEKDLERPSTDTKDLDSYAVPNVQERLEVPYHTATPPRDSIAELQELIDQSLKDNFVPSAGNTGRVDKDSCPQAEGDYEITNTPTQSFNESAHKDAVVNSAHEHNIDSTQTHIVDDPTQKYNVDDPTQKYNAGDPTMEEEQDILMENIISQSNACGCNENPSNRFEIFLRERTRPLTCSRQLCGIGKASGNIVTLGGSEFLSSHTPTLHADLRQTQQPKSRYWRWWKLVLNERESEDPTDIILEAELDPGESNAQQVYMGKDHISPSPLPMESCNEDLTRGKDSPTASKHQPPSPGLEMTDQSSPQSLLQGNCVIQVKDIFGNGVLVDHDEIPVDALDSLCLLNTSEVVATHRRKRQGQRLRQAAQLEPAIPQNLGSIPKEAIAPIMQNDGASCLDQQLQHAGTNPREAAQVHEDKSTNSCPLVTISPHKQEILMQTCGEAASEEKAKKIIVSIEDGAKRLVLIEILPGRAMAVVKRETIG